MYTPTSVFASLAAFVALASSASVANNETHTIKFTNKCGNGTQPVLMVDGKPVTLNGDSYTTKQPVVHFRTFLRDAKCGQEGKNCPYIAGALQNQISYAAIFVLPNVTDFHPLSYTFQDGGNCNGITQNCNTVKCPEAIHTGLPPIITPPVMFPGKNCTGDNANIEIQFCGAK